MESFEEFAKEFNLCDSETVENENFDKLCEDLEESVENNENVRYKMYGKTLVKIKKIEKETKDKSENVVIQSDIRSDSCTENDTEYVKKLKGKMELENKKELIQEKSKTRIRFTNKERRAFAGEMDEGKIASHKRRNHLKRLKYRERKMKKNQISYEEDVKNQMKKRAQEQRRWAARLNGKNPQM